MSKMGNKLVELQEKERLNGMRISVPVTYLIELDMDVVDQETAKGQTVQELLNEIKRGGINSRFVRDYEIAHVGNLIGGNG